MADAPLHLDSFIPYRLSFTTALVSDRIATVYQTLFDLSIPEWRVLAWVAEREGITQQEICALTRMDKVTVSRAAIALLDRGLIERTPHDTDRRSYQLKLSASGRALYARIAPKARELERQIFAEFTPKELESFVAMLRRIDNAALSLG